MQDFILEGARNHIHDLTGFDSLELVELEEGFAKVEAATATGFGNTQNSIHGGVLMTMCDMTASAAVYSFCKRNVTLQCNFNFIRPVAINGAARMTCEARVAHNGRQTVVVDVVLKNGEGKTCVKATFTQYITEIISEGDPIPQTAVQRAAHAGH